MTTVTITWTPNDYLFHKQYCLYQAHSACSEAPACDGEWCLAGFKVIQRGVSRGCHSLTAPLDEFKSDDGNRS